MKHTPEQQQQERQERLQGFLSDNPTEGDPEAPSGSQLTRPPPLSRDRPKPTLPPPIKVEFGIEADDANCSAWIRDELSTSALGIQQWPAPDLVVDTIVDSSSPLGEISSPLGNPDSTLHRSVEEAMASDWMGSYGDGMGGIEGIEGMGGDGMDSPLLTPTGLQAQIADVF